MGADVADPVSVCNFLAFRDLQIVDKKDSTGAGNVLTFRAGFSYFVANKSALCVVCWTFKKSTEGGFFFWFFLGRCG